MLNSFFYAQFIQNYLSHKDLISLKIPFALLSEFLTKLFKSRLSVRLMIKLKALDKTYTACKLQNAIFLF